MGVNLQEKECGNGRVKAGPGFREFIGWAGWIQ
jgi:hypothetical protein